MFQSVLVEKESKPNKQSTVYPLLAQRSILSWTRDSIKSMLFLFQPNTIQLMISVEFFFLYYNLLAFFLVKFNISIKCSQFRSDYFTIFITESVVFLTYYKYSKSQIVFYYFLVDLFFRFALFFTFTNS